MSTNSSKLVINWVHKIQSSCSCIKWVNETYCVRKPVCTNPENETGKCSFNFCPKVLKKQNRK